MGRVAGRETTGLQHVLLRLAQASSSECAVFFFFRLCCALLFFFAAVVGSIGCALFPDDDLPPRIALNSIRGGLLSSGTSYIGAGMFFEVVP